MEFDKSVGVLFRDVITKVDNRLHVCRVAGNSFQDLRQHLFHIVDKMGEASARAQGLPGSITTGRRVESSEHHLYIMRDTETSNKVIGFLKVGRKRLFVYDRHGQQWEMNPLCILDFYVHESRQRMGCGRRLFDFMVKSENLAPQHFAIDRPSHKFSSFLAKHYGLRAEIPQTNNFVIFEGFFTNRPGEGDFINNGRRGNGRPADYPSNNVLDSHRSAHNNNYSKQHQHQNSKPPTGQRGNQVAAGMPSSGRSPQLAQQEHGGLNALNLNPRSAHNMGAQKGRASPKGGYSDTELRSLSAGSLSNTSQGMVLQNSMYSRHQGGPAADQTPNHPNPAYNPKQSSSYSVAQRPPSGSRKQAAERDRSPPLLPREGPPRDYLTSFNMHQDYQGRGGHLKVPADPRVGIQPATASSTMAGTTTVTGLLSDDSSNSTQAPVADVETPSDVDRPYSNYQYTWERQASIRLPAIGDKKQVLTGTLNSARLAYGHGYYTQPVMYANGDNSWTVTGVLRNQNQLSARNYGHSRLW